MIMNLFSMLSSHCLDILSPLFWFQWFTIIDIMHVFDIFIIIADIYQDLKLVLEDTII